MAIRELTGALALDTVKVDYLQRIRSLCSEAFATACADTTSRRLYKEDIKNMLDRLVSDFPLADEQTYTDASATLPTKAPSLWLDRTDRAQAPIDFIRITYAEWLGHGLTQAHIRRLDKSLYMALHKWLQSNDMPADFDLPTQKQMNDRQLSEMWPSPDAARPGRAAPLSPDDRERSRLYQAARRRQIG